MTDLIFWYTGWIVWAVFGLGLLVAVGLSATVIHMRCKESFARYRLLRWAQKNGETETSLRSLRWYFDNHGTPCDIPVDDFFDWIEQHSKEYDREMRWYIATPLPDTRTQNEIEEGS